MICWKDIRKRMGRIWNYDYFTNKFRHIPEGVQIVCTGTAQAHFAFDFSGCGVRAFNMAVWRNSFTYSKLLLEKYKYKIAPHAVVLVTLQYPNFLCDRKYGITMENALQYSKILFGRDPEVSVIRQCVYRILPDRWFSSENFDTIQKVEQRNRKVNHYKIWELEQIAENVLKAWAEATGCDGFELCGSRLRQDYNIKIEEGIKEVTALVDLCEENGWQPVLVSLPFSKIMNDRISEDFKKYCFYECIEGIAKKIGCLWLDYSRDERMENMDYYMDVWWLNERGRKGFTKIVLDECRKRSLIVR